MHGMHDFFWVQGFIFYPMTHGHFCFLVLGFILFPLCFSIVSLGVSLWLSVLSCGGLFIGFLYFFFLLRCFAFRVFDLSGVSFLFILRRFVIFVFRLILGFSRSFLGGLD